MGPEWGLSLAPERILRHRGGAGGGESCGVFPGVGETSAIQAQKALPNPARRGLWARLFGR
jgi:hypothetical protein